jgi:hypothetical protein
MLHLYSEFHDDWLCDVCCTHECSEDPVTPVSGRCSVCGAFTDPGATRCVLHEDDWHSRMRTGRRLVTWGLYSDWDTGTENHRWRMTKAGAVDEEAGQLARLDVRLAVFLAELNVEYADNGRDSLGDEYLSGWWRFPDQAA